MLRADGCVVTNIEIGLPASSRCCIDDWTHLITRLVIRCVRRTGWGGPESCGRSLRGAPRVGWTGIVWPAGAASAVTAAKVAQAANPAVAKAVVVRRVGGRKVRTVGLQGDVGVTGRGGG